jgi:hypothetical protein
MKRKIKYGILLISLLSVVFFSCKKKEYTPLFYGYDYFPNKVGHYVIYECDSLVKTAGFGDINYHYQIKEVIDSIFNNNQGQPTQRIVRYKRTDTTIPWSNILTPEKVWTGALLSNMATRLEDNVNYVKLVFPASLSETWNGNVLNTIGPYSYQYTSLNIPYTLTTINSKTIVPFDSTLTVLEYRDSTFLSYNYYFEQYAVGIGMIHRIYYYDSSSTIIPCYTSPDTSNANTWGVWYTETCLTSGNQ